MAKCIHFPWREIEKKNGHRNKNNQSHMGGPVLLISFPKICGLDVFRSLSLCTQSEMNFASFPLALDRRNDRPISRPTVRFNQIISKWSKRKWISSLTWHDATEISWCCAFWSHDDDEVDDDVHDVLSKKPDADTFKCLTHSLFSDWNLIEYYYGRHN